MNNQLINMPLNKETKPNQKYGAPREEQISSGLLAYFVNHYTKWGT